MIKLVNITKTITQGASQTSSILSSIDFELSRGDFISIMGPSGSGKSSLLNIIGLLDEPTSGEYYFDNLDVYNLTDRQLAGFRSDRIGFIFQSFMLIPRLSVAENIEIPLIYRDLNGRTRREKVLEAIERVGLEKKYKNNAVDLSGGEKQRVAIARALVNHPDLLLADEPTGNLDQQSKEDILGIFQQLHQEGSTIIIVTHDEEVAQVTQQKYKLRAGKWEDSASVGLAGVQI